MSNVNSLTEIIEKHWSRSTNKKINTAKKLIEFKSTVKRKNSHMLYILRNEGLSNNKKQRLVIKCKKNLISYIGTWTINIQQRVLNYKKVKNSLKYFISSEHYLLKPFIDHYLIKAKHTTHYSDALSCEYLYKKCSSPETHHFKYNLRHKFDTIKTEIIKYYKEKRR